MLKMADKAPPISAPGCDDAPVVGIPEAGRSKPVTLIMPYYENPLTLAEHVRRWSAFPTLLRLRLRAIIVDDGSPNKPAETVLRGLETPFPVRLARIEEDVRWNWLAARNLGFSLAPEGWCVVTDIDHHLTEATAQALVTGAHDPRVIYRFSRREAGGEAIPAHPNSWFMTRAMFWNVGGYDEALSGYYGTDGEYRRRAVEVAPIRIMTDELVREEFARDSSTTRYLRKQPEDRAVYNIIRARRPGWQPKVLSFPWHEVQL
jgi:hypothetical protein